jgi:glycosyltransferase involved in cell wall biosynthesis
VGVLPLELKNVGIAKMPKVSVIIPTYNRAELLAGAIASVLNQTFQDFELLVVDDASQDTTAEIVKGFRDPRIQYLSHALNMGGSAARNTGIQKAKSPYLAFLDDDDEWLPKKLALQLHVLENSPPEVGGVYTGYIHVDRYSGQILGSKAPTLRGDLSKELLRANCIGSTSSILLRKECFETSGLFDARLPSFQDYDLWLRISFAFQFECIEQPLFKYYDHKHKIWTNPQALSIGIEMMLHRYGNSFLFRKNFSYYYLFLGVLYCNLGDVYTARQVFKEGIKLYPYEGRHYFNFCLSLLGSNNFKKAKNIKDKIANIVIHRQ